MKDVGCGVLFFLLSLQKIITMKKLLFLAISLMCVQFAIAQGWNANLVSSTEKEIVVELNVDGYVSNNVVTPNGDAVVITNKKMMLMAQAGEPNVPSVVIPTIIGDNALMDVEIVDAQYVDYQNVEIAPSKGDFPRSVNPEDVPYTYGAMYKQDAFYPAQMARLDEPYIHRDVRGQNIIVTPYTYNPVTKTLRVYNHIVVRMKNIGVDSRNVFANRSNSTTLSYEFEKMYENRYINYQESNDRYTAIAEDGELLIICHDAFMTAMEPFVTWKKQIGRPTTMVGTSTTGTTEAAIKSYLQTYYAAHPNLTDILLVGDVAQIPGAAVSAGSGYNGYSGKGDLPYGQLAGNDSYNEVLVGRFCCENAAQVTNQVNKVLNYERDLDQTATWLSVGQGVSTTAGNGGHYNEDDYQHIDNLRNDLLGYGYTNVYRDYKNVNGSTASNANGVSQHINSGVSIINYCNHGSETGWGVFNYSNSHVNALTNDYKLPYVISVACLVGKYDYSGGCFAEAWMRATNNSNGNPTGAIGGMFSYISQPWVPPMYGQDEMVDILVESYANNIKRTMGGVSINGNMKVLDQGATQNPNKGTYNCWILFGDPTLTLRTATPTVMSVTAASSMTTTATSFTVSATNANGARATLTRNGEIMGSAIINNGSANITFTAPGSTGTATLTVFGYNKKTYVSTVNIVNGTPIPVTVTVTATEPIIPNGGSTRLRATATGGNGTYVYSWTPAETLTNPASANPTATPTATTTYTCTVTSGGYTDTQSCTVEVVNAPANLTAEVVDEANVTLNWDAANLVTTYGVFVNNFEFYTDITETTYTIENMLPGTYTFNVMAHYNGVNSPKSNSVTVIIEEPTPVVCPGPINFIGEYYYLEGEFGAHLMWDNADYTTSLDRYEVYRSNNGVKYELIRSIVETPSISHYECYDQLDAAGEKYYRIVAFYKDGCESDPEDIAVFVTSAGENWADNVALYPNPTSGKVSIKAEAMRQITIINVMGQVVMSQAVDNNDVTLDMSMFDNGMYIVNVITENGKVVKTLNVLR